MDSTLKLARKSFGVVAAMALLLGVLAAPIGETKADVAGPPVVGGWVCNLDQIACGAKVIQGLPCAGPCQVAFPTWNCRCAVAFYTGLCVCL